MESSGASRKRTSKEASSSGRKDTICHKKHRIGHRHRSKGEAGHLGSLTALERHRVLVGNYVKYYSSSSTEPKLGEGGRKGIGGRQNAVATSQKTTKTDFDTLKETYRFIRSEEDDRQLPRWEKKLAKKYYDKLFKEYCIADLRFHAQGKVGMRWRSEKEVIAGKGQFVCGEKNCCEDRPNLLQTFEVNFAYNEGGVRRNALVKLRLCASCGPKLKTKRLLERPKGKEKVLESKGTAPTSEEDSLLNELIL